MLKLIFRVCLATLLVASVSWANSLDPEILIRKVNSPDYGERLAALKAIEKNLIQHEALSLALEERLLQHRNTETMNRRALDEVAWMCKAYAVAGEPSHEIVLLEVADTTQEILSRHCKKAASRLPYYYSLQQEKPKAAPPAIPGLTEELAKAVSFVQSGDGSEQRKGAKLILNTYTQDIRVYNYVRDALVKKIKQPELDQDDRDALAWMCNCLSVSGRTRYLEPLQVIWDTTTDPKVKYFAQKAIEELVAGQGQYRYRGPQKDTTTAADVYTHESNKPLVSEPKKHRLPEKDTSTAADVYTHESDKPL